MKPEGGEDDDDDNGCDRAIDDEKFLDINTLLDGKLAVRAIPILRAEDTVIIVYSIFQTCQACVCYRGIYIDSSCCICSSFPSKMMKMANQNLWIFRPFKIEVVHVHPSQKNTSQIESKHMNMNMIHSH